VWSLVRDFNGLPAWVPAVAKSKIEGGLDADVVGCVRSFHTHDGGHVRERLLMLDDAHYTFAYNFEKPAFPVRHYVATLRLYPVTHTDRTFAEWSASFDEAPGDEGKYEKIISKTVFATNFRNLARILAARRPAKPEGAERWKGFAPNKVWTSRVIKAPATEAWKIMRDFAGMGALRPAPVAGDGRRHHLRRLDRRLDRQPARRPHADPEHRAERLPARVCDAGAQVLRQGREAILNRAAGHSPRRNA
jgi:hypothetical protein